MRKPQTGVTLIELMVVVVIIGILSAIAVPAYRNYIIRANRADARVSLLSTAGALERCFTRFNAYNDPACAVGQAAVSIPSPDGNYLVTLFNITPNTFTLQATPQGGQVRDVECAVFRYTQANVRTVTGTKNATPQDCWGR
jgi:type IV pilus assembly protein PilE